MPLLGYLPLLLLLPFFTNTNENQTVVDDTCADEAGVNHVLWDVQLGQFVSDKGVVDYSGWQSQESALDKYLEELSKAVPTATMSADAQMAYWINAYNAFTVKLILDNYPIKSIMKLDKGKVWDRKWIGLGGDVFSLNDIEHEILRKQFDDPRIHFVVNCAAKSCPPLWNRAFTKDNLELGLEKRTRSFINNPSYNSLHKKKLTLSKIFDWYRQDFGDLVAYVSQYTNMEIDKSATVNFHEYDWSLNE
jgi:hypothetical protein